MSEKTNGYEKWNIVHKLQKEKQKKKKKEMMRPHWDWGLHCEVTHNNAKKLHTQTNETKQNKMCEWVASWKSSKIVEIIKM